MSAERDTTRIVRSWLRADDHESADRLLDTVLARLDATPQRRSWWPAWRTPMRPNLKAAITAAAVLVVALVGYQLLPKSPGTGGPALPTPSPPAAATAPPAIVFPSAGPLAAGTYRANINGFAFTFTVPIGWASSSDCDACTPQGATLQQANAQGPQGVWMPIWAVDAAYTDPCGGIRGPVASSAADLAADIAAIPGVEVSEPVDVAIGSLAAKHLVVTFPATLGCSPGSFKLWAQGTIGRFVTAPNSIDRLWIFEVDGRFLVIEGETYEGAAPERDAEIQAVIDSIEFTK